MAASALTAEAGADAATRVWVIVRGEGGNVADDWVSGAGELVRSGDAVPTTTSVEGAVSLVRV